MELSITEVFGPGATQSATQFTVLKADLPGLTPSAGNSPDAIVLSQLNKWVSTYTPAARTANPDISIVATLQPIPQVQGLFTDPNNPVAYDVSTYQIQVFVPRQVVPPSPDDVE